MTVLVLPAVLSHKFCNWIANYVNVQNMQLKDNVCKLREVKMKLIVFDKGIFTVRPYWDFS